MVGSSTKQNISHYYSKFIKNSSSYNDEIENRNQNINYENKEVSTEDLNLDESSINSFVLFDTCKHNSDCSEYDNNQFQSLKNIHSIAIQTQSPLVKLSKDLIRKILEYIDYDSLFGEKELLYTSLAFNNNKIKFDSKSNNSITHPLENEFNILDAYFLYNMHDSIYITPKSWSFFKTIATFRLQNTRFIKESIRNSINDSQSHSVNTILHSKLTLEWLFSNTRIKRLYYLSKEFSKYDGLNQIEFNRLSQTLVYLRNSKSIQEIHIRNPNPSDFRSLEIGLSNCHGLKTLNLDSCNIDFSVLSKILDRSVNIHHLSLKRRGIKESDNAPLFQYLSSNQTIEILDFGYNLISSNDAPFFNNILIENKKLRVIDLENCKIDDKFIIQVSSYLRNNTTLEKIILYNNEITNIGAYYIIEALKFNSTIKMINLKKNFICQVASTSITHLLLKNKSLKKLSLSNCNLIDNDIIDLSYSISLNKSIQYLDISSNIISFEGFKSLCSAISRNTSLHTLKLNFISILQEYSVFIGNMLKSNNTLKELYCSNCGIDEISIERICEGLKMNSSLKLLFLPLNQIGAKGAKILAHSIRNIEILNLERNNISDFGAQSICEALLNNPISKLNLSGNDIDVIGVEYVSELVSSSKTLKSLNLANNRFDAYGLSSLCQAIKENISLESLNLCSNSCHDFEIINLIKSLYNSKTIKILDLRGNNLGDEAALIIGEFLKKTEILKRIHLDLKNCSSETIKTFFQLLKNNECLSLIDITTKTLSLVVEMEINRIFESNPRIKILINGKFIYRTIDPDIELSLRNPKINIQNLRHEYKWDDLSEIMKFIQFNEKTVKDSILKEELQQHNVYGIEFNSIESINEYKYSLYNENIKNIVLQTIFNQNEYSSTRNSISNYPNINSISIKSNYISNNNLKIFILDLNNATKLKHFFASGLYLDDQSCKYLFGNSSLKSIKLMNTSFSKNGIEVIAQELVNSNTLKKLDLSQNVLQSYQIKILSQALEMNKKLEILYLDYIKFDALNSSIIFEIENETRILL